MRTETMTSQGKAVKTKLFIGNLDPSTQTAELHDLFAPFGNVLEASVIKDYGFVHFGSVEEAEKAVAGLNNKEFHGKRLRVELSTSTVRHRPGQPEPTSSLRNSRPRSGTSNVTNASRYTNAGPPAGNVGPIRHNSSNMARNEARPYGHMPREALPPPPPPPPPQSQMTPDYYSGPGPYERQRSYDSRAEPRRFYPDGHDNAYQAPYDASPYPPAPRGPIEPQDTYGNRSYRDMPPHSRMDNPGYPPSRTYDHHGDGSPVDPYYDGPMNSGPPPPVDNYRNYDPYLKYYPERSREPDYHGPPPNGPLMSRDYDLYSNYRQDPYGQSNSQPPPMRGNPNVGPPPQLQQQHQHQHQQQQSGYQPGPPQTHRQQSMYGSGSSAGSGSSGYQNSAPYHNHHHHHYYGAHNRP